MKELTGEFKDNKVEIVSEKEQRKEVKLIGSQRKIRGLTLWEYNEVTKLLTPAKYKPLSVFISSTEGNHETTTTYKVVTNENCIYVQALNKKNALKKLKK